MQPVLSVATETPGVIYVNGRMVGEADGDHAPMLPVSPYGAVIVEHRPFGGDHLPLCARLVFSAGEPVAASLAGQAGVSAICWPDGVTELMLAPFRLRCAPCQRAVHLSESDHYDKFHVASRARILLIADASQKTAAETQCKHIKAKLLADAPGVHHVTIFLLGVHSQIIRRFYPKESFRRMFAVCIIRNADFRFNARKK